MSRNERIWSFLSSSSRWLWQASDTQEHDEDGAGHNQASPIPRRDSFFGRIEEEMRQAAAGTPDGSTHSINSLRRARSCPRSNSWESNGTFVSTRSKYPWEEEGAAPDMSPGYSAYDPPVPYDRGGPMYTANELWQLDRVAEESRLLRSSLCGRHHPAMRPDPDDLHHNSDGSIGSPFPGDGSALGGASSAPRLTRRNSSDDASPSRSSNRVEPQAAFYVHRATGSTPRLAARNHTARAKFFEQSSRINNPEGEGWESASSDAST